MSQLAEEQPNVPWPYVELAELHTRLGQPAEAARWAQLAAEADTPGRWPTERQRYLIRDCQEYLDELTYVFGTRPEDASPGSR